MIACKQAPLSFPDRFAHCSVSRSPFFFPSSPRAWSQAKTMRENKMANGRVRILLNTDRTANTLYSLLASSCYLLERIALYCSSVNKSRNCAGTPDLSSLHNCLGRWPAGQVIVYSGHPLSNRSGEHSRNIQCKFEL